MVQTRSSIALDPPGRGVTTCSLLSCHPPLECRDCACHQAGAAGALACNMAAARAAGIGALLDDRGVGKGILMHNPDMKPQMESKTKFEDVKGVDEAKVRP